MMNVLERDQAAALAQAAGPFMPNGTLLIDAARRGINMLELATGVAVPHSIGDICDVMDRLEKLQND